MKVISGLSEGQVLQRRGAGGANVVLKGECETGRLSVTIRRGGRTLPSWRRRKAGASKGGRFSLALADVPVGGPYSLRIESDRGEIAEIKEFYVGDVWILAGQSNMEGVGRLPSSVKTHPLVRAFSLRREWRLAADPLHVPSESPDECHNGGYQITSELSEKWRKQAPTGAGVGISFAREMVRRARVPQGLICAARGGSAMNLWSARQKGQLYASMITSVRATSQPVAGVLWYQGESDTGGKEVVAYTENMRKLVAATRQALGQPRLPWIRVQLARVFRPGKGEGWNGVQEQQRRLPGRIPRLEVVAAIDLSFDDEIHLDSASLSRLGVRLAVAASRLVHGARGEIVPPRLLGIRRTPSTPKIPALKCGIDVAFDGVVGGISSNGEPSLRAVSLEVKDYDDGFINEHEVWQRKSGHAFFAATIKVGKPRSLEFLMGYDGPFRLWLDGRPFFSNPHGGSMCRRREHESRAARSRKARDRRGDGYQSRTELGIFSSLPGGRGQEALWHLPVCALAGALKQVEPAFE